MADAKGRNTCWDTPLGKWLGGYGAPRLATELGLTVSAPYQWVYGNAIPRREVALLVVFKAEGAITMDDIFRQKDLIEAMSTDASKGGTVHAG